MKKIRKTISITILIIIISTITFFIGKQIGLNTEVSATNTTIEEKEVSKRTINKTLTATGEIGTATTEKLTIDTTKYFEMMCVEEDDTVKEGENLLKYSNGTYLVAPYDLVVSSYSAPNTGTKATSSNYVEVKGLKNLTTTLTINENEIANISLNQEVEVTLTSDTSKKYVGKITKIDGIGTYSSSGTNFATILSFENDGTAKLGMSVSCTINIKELRDVLTVPINSVQTTNNKKYVRLVENGEIKETEIQTGLSNDEYVQVTSGLEEGQIVQVVTTTKQNTVRNSNKNSNKGGFEMRDEANSKQNFDKSAMPPDMGYGGMSSGGEMPSMKNN